MAHIQKRTTARGETRYEVRWTEGDQFKQLSFGRVSRARRYAQVLTKRRLQERGSVAVCPIMVSTELVDEMLWAYDAWPWAFAANVDVAEGCWNWLGHCDKGGYGRYRHHSAHRQGLILLGDAVPDDLVADHLCRNRACVRPDHLELVTVAENNRRGLAGARMMEGR